MHVPSLLVLVTSLFTLQAVAAPAAPAVPEMDFADLEKRATGPSYTSKSFIDAVLNTHNKNRKAHHSVSLTWDNTLAKYANKYANKCVFQHTGGPYGENLYAIFPGYSNWASGTADGVTAWFNEQKYYNYSKPGFSAQTGHFTQAVWNGSKKVGCSWNTVNCKGAAYLFCEYSPPGNVIGYFPENVFPIKK